MVRREEAVRVPASAVARLSSRCATPTGASPVPVSAEAPGSGPQPSGGDAGGRAGRREPAAGQPVGREQARGPQHEVKPAASKELQTEGRAAHFTAKATPRARVSERSRGLGGVWGAARVQGVVWNTGDPSALPSSRQGASYQPMAKSAAAQRESEGVEVPSMRARQNARGGKDPCFGRARREGKREGMAAKSGPNDPVAILRDVQVREPRSELWAGAERGTPRRPRVVERLRSDARSRTRGRRESLLVHASPGGPSVSRVREIRTHGLKGGPALSLVSFDLNL